MDNNGTYLTELSELKTGKLMEQWQTHNKLSVHNSWYILIQEIPGQATFFLILWEECSL